MSVKSMNWVFWLLFLFTLPVPFLGIQAGFAPTARWLYFGNLVGRVFLRDPDSMSGLMASMYLGEGLLYALVLYFVARLAARALAFATLERSRKPVLAALVIASLAFFSLFDCYDTPISSYAPRSSLLELFL